jgi:hypothetical protein
MTRLLEEAIERARELPDSVQDALARRLLDEIEEEAFDALIASRPDLLEAMAERVLDEHRRGLTMPLNFDEL